MSVPLGIRSFKEGPYHYCGRCGTRVHIKELEWERGVLVCKTMNCQDKGPFAQIGQRETAIERNLEQPTKELQPDQKLLEPSISAIGDDDIFF